MKKARVGGTILEYEDRGRGDAIVFIHGVLIADAFVPLAAEPALARRYRLITYRRRGYGGSSPVRAPFGIRNQAADCAALLRRLGVERAHVVAHSYGGCVALQMALDMPELVRSLALLEPGLMIGATAAGYREALAGGVARFRREGAAPTVDAFTRARWPEYATPLEAALPGAFAQAVADAATTFEVELPAALEWQFGEDDLRRVTQPVLAVLGGDSDALWSRFGEVQRLLLALLPRAEGFVLPGTTHLMQLQKPRDLATALAAFYERL